MLWLTTRRCLKLHQTMLAELRRQNELLDKQNESLRHANFDRLIPLLENIAASIDELKRNLVPFVPTPGVLNVEIVGKKFLEDDMKVLLFSVQLPDLEIPRAVESRHLTITIDGIDITRIVAKDVETIENLEGPENVNVVLSLRDSDEHGNMSDASEITVVLTDTIPPPVPGTLGVIVTGERYEPDSSEPEPGEPDEPVETLDESGWGHQKDEFGGPEKPQSFG